MNVIVPITLTSPESRVGLNFHPRAAVTAASFRNSLRGSRSGASGKCQTGLHLVRNRQDRDKAGAVHGCEAAPRPAPRQPLSKNLRGILDDTSSFKDRHFLQRTLRAQRPLLLNAVCYARYTSRMSKMIAVRLKDEVLLRVDRERKRDGLTRAAAINQALQLWVEKRQYDEAVRSDHEGYERHPVGKDEFESILGAQPWPK